MPGWCEALLLEGVLRVLKLVRVLLLAQFGWVLQRRTRLCRRHHQYYYNYYYYY